MKTTYLCQSQDAILVLYNVEYTVAANDGLWKEPHIFIENAYYQLAATFQKMLRFTDPSSVIFIGFIIENIRKVDHEPLKILTEMINTEVSSYHKNSSRHLDCTRTER